MSVRPSLADSQTHRGSFQASKATGYPLAFMAAKLSLGCREHFSSNMRRAQPKRWHVKGRSDRVDHLFGVIKMHCLSAWFHRLSAPASNGAHGLNRIELPDIRNTVTQTTVSPARRALPKRWHVGRADRVDHLFGAGVTDRLLRAVSGLPGDQGPAVGPRQVRPVSAQHLS